MKTTFLLLINIIVSLFFWAFLCPSFLLGQRSLPENNLSYPVLLKIDSTSTGSGFFYQHHNEVYLVTAGHVLFDLKKDSLIGRNCVISSYSEDLRDTTKNIYTLNLGAMLLDGLIRWDKKTDVAVINFEDYNNKSIQVKQIATKGIVVVADGNIIPFDSVDVANDVFIFGYPTSLGLKQFPQIDYE